MKRSLLAVVLAAGLLSACTGVSYGHRAYAPTQSDEEIAANSARIQAAERAERKEARQERREEMMDEADAINRAYKGLPPTYIIY